MLFRLVKATYFLIKKYNLVYGIHLKKIAMRGVAMKILYYKVPSHIHKVKYKKAIDRLLETKISEDETENNKIQKTILNIIWGLMEKGFNKKTVNRMFDNVKEALNHRDKYGGKIYVLDDIKNELHQEWKELKDGWSIETNEYGNYFINEEGNSIITSDAFEYLNEDGKTYYHYIDRDVIKEEISKTAKYYIVSVSDERELMNGFRFIKELLLQNHNFSMYDAYEKLKENNINVYAVKTDAFHVAKKDLRKARKILEFGSNVGKWRVENKKVNYVEDTYKWKYNELVKIPIYKSERVEIEDEWNVENICEKIIRRKRMMIRAKYAGSGKSFIGKHLQKMGYETLFVVPQNMLKQEIECDAVTLNTFFSIAIGGGKLPPYDYSGFKVIVFDEIYMSSPFILNKIRKFAEEHPELIIIGAGDVKQLPSIEPYTNCQNVEDYVDNCLDMIFEYNMYLKICKRVGGKDTEEGDRNRRKLDMMYDDFWIKNMNVKEWISKHFKFTNDVMMSENNIAYTNIRCQAVANEVRKRLGKKGKYEVSEILICRLYRNEEEGKFNVNIRWKILDVKDGMVTLQDIKNTEDVRELDEKDVDKHFRYAYCATCHSRQGTSISGNITIHEWNKDYLVSKEWLWCAITRARDFNKVYFFKMKKQMRRCLEIWYQIILRTNAKNTRYKTELKIEK